MLATHREIIQTAASTASAVMFLLSVCIALYQLKRTRLNQKESTARNIFNDYLKISIQYPDIAFPQRSSNKFDFSLKTFDGSTAEFERYEWYVSLMIFSMKEILEIFSGDYYWESTAERQISYHMEYIRWRRAAGMYNFIFLAGNNVKTIIDRLESGETVRNQFKLDQLPVRDALLNKLITMKNKKDPK